jgi:UDP-GlcNAc:undecaprenyl-phosphate GlcNAc-1-phosphate transferase
MNYNLILIAVFLNLSIIFFHKKIVKIFNIYDKNDGIRKLQKISIPVIGGLIIALNIFIISSLDIFFKLNFIDDYFFTNNRETFSFFAGLFSFYLFGLYDDKFNLNANIKLLISSFLVIFFTSIDNNLLINNLKFSFLQNTIELKNFSYFFTILSFLLFFNALNMFDGINMQVASYSLLIFLIFIFKGIFINISVFIIISLFFFLILNSKNKAYMGDGGVYLLSYVISYIFIKSYNRNLFIADEIFFIMLLPGLDMLRVFLLRLSNGKNPFKPDRNHLHHLLLNYFSDRNVFLIIFIYIFLVILLYYFINPIILFFSALTLYLITLFFIKIFAEIKK